jgi:hypothetical protein
MFFSLASVFSLWRSPAVELILALSNDSLASPAPVLRRVGTGSLLASRYLISSSGASRRVLTYFCLSICYVSQYLMLLPSHRKSWK